MTTPPPPNDPSSTDGKLPGEAELAALYRQLPQSEPSPALDAAVLQAAAQALDDADNPQRTERRKGARESGDWVHPRSHAAADSRAIPAIGLRRRGRRVPSWVVALGSAASLVLVAGLAWHMRTAPGGNTVQAGRVAPSTPMAAAPSQVARLADNADAKPTAAQTEDLANRARRQSMARGAADSVEPVIVTEPATQPRAARYRPSAQNAKPTTDKVYAARVNAPAAMAMPPPPPPVREVSAAPIVASPPSPSAPAAPLASPLPTSLAVGAQLSAKKAAAAKDNPAQELDAIQQLFAQGHDDEARQRLLDFRRAHPRWPLPPALQAQLPKP